MIDKNKRAAIISDIEAHLLTSGSCDWRTVRNHHGDVSNATFWRILREVKQAKAQQADRPNPIAADATSSVSARESIDPLPLLFPGVLSTSYLTFEFEQAREDLDRMRAYCLDAEGKVTQPSTFNQYLKLRDRLVEDIMCRRMKLVETDRIDALWKALAEGIMGLDMELGRKVVQIIDEVNARCFETIERRAPRRR
jgi:hypothetical protein